MKIFSGEGKLQGWKGEILLQTSQALKGSKENNITLGTKIQQFK